MDWIRDVAALLSAEEWQAVGAMGTLVVAVAAAVFAWFQVRESARLRREQSRPYVVVYVDRVAATILDLVVKNFGTTAARDVRLTWNRPPTMRWDKEADALDLFESLPLLVPDQEWRSVWDVHGHRIEDKEAPYIVTVTSRDSRGRRLPEETFNLGTEHFAHELMWDQNGLHEIGESLKKIERSVDRWGEGFDGLKVWVRDGSKKDKEWRERYEATRAARKSRAEEAASNLAVSAKKRAPRKK